MLSSLRINLAGHWIPVSYNPGLHARNRYGYNIYKHAQHWLETGKTGGIFTLENLT